MSDSWWAKKLGNVPDNGQPMPPATQPPRAPAPQQSPMQRQAPQQGLPVREEAVAPPQDVEEGMDRLKDPNAYATVRRKSVETGNDGTCPECLSGNYFENIRSDNRATGGKPATPRCYDCGYPITHGLNA